MHCDDRCRRLGISHFPLGAHLARPVLVEGVNESRLFGVAISLLRTHVQIRTFLPLSSDQFECSQTWAGQRPKIIHLKPGGAENGCGKRPGALYVEFTSKFCASMC
jgi:hypothetical protein